MKPDVLLTIFSAPKPCTNPHIAMIQQNAVSSWKALGERVEVVLIGNEAGISELAAGASVTHIPEVACNSWGTPLISDMFLQARIINDSPLMACVNSDILLLPDFMETAQNALIQLKGFLLVGRRYDLALSEYIVSSAGWGSRLEEKISKEGRLHPPGGSDYFIYPRDCFQDIPDFAIGRAGWDNWMIYEARQRGWKVIDATGSIHVVHQDHDYSHLAGGEAHYRHPETEANVRLAGGKRTIFTLGDAQLCVKDGQILPIRRTWKKFWREVEIFPLIILHSFLLSQFFYSLFHPLRAYIEFRAWLRSKKS